MKTIQLRNGRTRQLPARAPGDGIEFETMSGENHRQAMFQAYEVIGIRNAAANGVALAELAAMFVCSPRTIYGVVKRRTYRDVE